MTTETLMDLFDCPICDGTALLEDEAGWCCYVTCLDCGCHTVEARYRSEEEKASAYETVKRLWNQGKVITSSAWE